MIYGLLPTIKKDVDVVVNYMHSQDIPGVEEENQEQRIQVAVLRMLAFVGMAFGALWTLSLIRFEVTISLQSALKLATATGSYVVTHDVFIMCHNVYKDNSSPSFELKPKLMDLFRGHESLDEEQGEYLTHGTFLQPCWMSFYVRS